MPRYDTKCTVCGNTEEVIIPMTSDLPVCFAKHEVGPDPSIPGNIIHRLCGGKREKVPSTTAIAFRGAGWTPRHY
jgi:predicted nucleic acid-binding Zn ribbon protein